MAGKHPWRKQLWENSRQARVSNRRAQTPRGVDFGKLRSQKTLNAGGRAMCQGLPPIPVSSTTGTGRSKISPALSEKPLKSTAAYQEMIQAARAFRSGGLARFFYDRVSVAGCCAFRALAKQRKRESFVNRVDADGHEARRPALRHHPARQACAAIILRRTCAVRPRSACRPCRRRSRALRNELIRTRRSGRATTVGSAPWRAAGRWAAGSSAARPAPRLPRAPCPSAPRRLPAPGGGPANSSSVNLPSLFLSRVSNSFWRLS